MGYNQPNQGCGSWYNWAVNEELIPDDSTCGIADTFFTEFDRDNYSRGITVNLIKTAKINIYNSMIELERDGKDLNNLSQETKNTISEINSLLNKAESKLNNKSFTDKAPKTVVNQEKERLTNFSQAKQKFEKQLLKIKN